MRLRTRFALSLLLLVVPVFGLALFQGWMFNRELMDTTTRRVYDTLSRIAQGMDAEVSRARLIAGTLAFDDGLNLIEQRRSTTDSAGILRLERAITQHYTSFFNVMRPEIAGVRMFYRNRDCYDIFPLLNPQDEQEQRRQDWYRRASATDVPAQIIDSLAPDQSYRNDRYELRVAVRPSREQGNGIELILLVMKPFFFNNVLRQLQVEQDRQSQEFYAIIDEGGRRLFPVNENSSPLPSRELDRLLAGFDPGSRPSVRQASAGPYLVCAQRLSTVPWHVVFFSNWKYLSAPSDRAGFWVLLGLFAVSLALAGFSLASYRSILRPLGILAARMDRYARGEDGLPSPEALAPEFHHVFERFDSMTAEIRELNEARLQAELAALQFQINPHFLSNTLSALRFMAMLSKANGMKDMVEELIGMMEYQMAPSGTASTIDNELANIRRYEAIMKVRFGDSFDLETVVPPDLVGHPVLRMLLQPVVENSIEHGLQGLNRRGRICVSAERYDPATAADPQLLIRITDNGHGIRSERLAGLLHPAPVPLPSRTRHRIGLANVQQRIQVHYGPNYGLEISSHPDTGCEVLFRLPLDGSFA